MKTLIKGTLALSLASGMLAFSAPQVLAWSCQAVASDGTYGYSYGYSNRREARRRALAECNARTYDDCWIEDCQRNG
jgi:hypothetical protein